MKQSKWVKDACSLFTDRDIENLKNALKKVGINMKEDLKYEGTDDYGFIFERLK